MIHGDEGLEAADFYCGWPGPLDRATACALRAAPADHPDPGTDVAGGDIWESGIPGQASTDNV